MAMDKTFGNITASAKKAGIARSVVYQWMHKDPKFAEKVNSEDYGEKFLDTLEMKLHKVAFIDENPSMLMFLAKTKGKKRGYIEKLEIENSGNMFLNLMMEATGEDQDGSK